MKGEERKGKEIPLQYNMGEESRKICLVLKSAFAAPSHSFSSPLFPQVSIYVDLKDMAVMRDALR